MVERLADSHEVSGSNPDVRLVTKGVSRTLSMVILVTRTQFLSFERIRT